MRNFEKTEVPLPRLEIYARTTHLALSPKILKANYFKRFDARNFEAARSQILRLGPNARTSYMDLSPKIPKKVEISIS